MSQPSADEFIKDAAENAPTGGLIKPAGSVPEKPKRTHPLAVGLKEAKQKIALILENVENLEKLGSALQDEFDDNPTKFLHTYEPLLRRYEEVEQIGKDDKVPIRVLGPTMIVTGKVDKGDLGRLGNLEEAEGD